MEIANLPEPVFRNEREDFVVTFYNGEYPEVFHKELKQDKKIQKNAQENAQEKNKKPTRKVSENSILNYCKEAKTIKEIAEKFGYKNIRNFREIH